MTQSRATFRSWSMALTGASALSALVLAGTAILGGCGLDLAYLLPAAAGQANILFRSVPIGRAIQQGRLTEEQVAKLELIQDTRAYALDVMSLNVENNFTKFYDSGDEPVAFNISASRKDAFEARWWTFPIVGTVPYLGFFDHANAEAKFDELVGEGLDVFMYEIDAYSGLGFIPNLVLSPILERTEISLVDTIFHELLHSTVWRANDTSFNESLATFYGRTGAVKYLADRHPDEPELVQEAIEWFEDGDRYTDFMLNLFDELDAFYSSDLSSEEKTNGREAIFRVGRERFATQVQPLMDRPQRYDWVQNLPVNNAWMLGIRRYNLDLEIFERVFSATGESWTASGQLFRDAANRSEPYAYLQAWLASNGEGSSRRSALAGLASTEKGQHLASPAREQLSRGPCPGRLATTILCPE